MKANTLCKVSIMLAILTVMACAQAQAATTWYSGGTTYAWTVGETGGAMTRIGPTVSDGWSGVAYGDGYLYVSQYYYNKVLRINTTTGLLDSGWEVNGIGTAWTGPTAVHFGPGGYLYATDTGHGNVVKIDVATQAKTDLMATGVGGALYDVAFDASGANAYVTATVSGVHHVYKYDTATWTQVAGFDITNAGFAYGIAVNPTDGMVYVSDYYGGYYGTGLHRYSTAGLHDDTWTPTLSWSYTKGLTFGPDGLLYIAADDLAIHRLDPAAALPTATQFATQYPPGPGGWSDNPSFITFKTDPVPEPSALAGLIVGVGWLSGCAGRRLRRGR